MLPCNVVVYEKDDGTTVISAMDPVDAIGAFGGEGFAELAAEVKTKLARAIETI